MLFNSVTFLVFLAVVFSLYQVVRGWSARKNILLVASYLFYAAWNPPFVILIWISTLVDYLVGRAMWNADGGRRKALVVVSLVVNLGLLGYFKYAGFLLDTFTGFAAALGVVYAPPAWSIVLPVGISFYTFQTLSYTIDVYRGKLTPITSLRDFALFVTFFPQLVAGPIVRASHFLPQLDAPKHPSRDQLSWGCTLLLVGLFEKIVLADSMAAPVVDQVYADTQIATGLEAWIGTLAFSSQIFFDFAGYSICAIGVALLFGFELPDNFRFPYAAVGFSDFWRRWHISLSTWLRDYLYIPLGGNRRGLRRTYINLSLTMLLGGLWHGASWQFIAWGALHGAYLMVERVYKSFRSDHPEGLWRPLPRPLKALSTYCAVSFAWVFFRAESFGSARELIGSMMSANYGLLILRPDQVATITVLTVVVLATQYLLRDSSIEEFAGSLPRYARVVFQAMLILAIIFAGADDRSFVYFQF